MNKQPEALGYANNLESRGYEAEAGELRRLHAENQALNDALQYSMSCHQEMSSLAIRQRARLDELEKTQAVPGVLPEIVERVLQSAGKTRRETHNPCITANECIRLANWIVANTNVQPKREPLTEEAIQKLLVSGDYLTIAGLTKFARAVECAHDIK